MIYRPNNRDRLLYPVSEAAYALGIGTRMMWAYIYRGEIETRLLGKRRLIHRREIERFANKDHEGVQEGDRT